MHWLSILINQRVFLLHLQYLESEVLKVFFLQHAMQSVLHLLVSTYLYGHLPQLIAHQWSKITASATGKRTV